MLWWIMAGVALALLKAALSGSSPQLTSNTAEVFEPPKYISSLIAAINDGAKAAQTGAFAFTAVGLYLFATALSTTDEDLLLQHTTSIAQLGVQVPVVFSFAIAPLVFVALHAFTLIRYDMLATNLRQFCADLDTMVEAVADRERCRQLLANVEFVVARAAPHSSPLHSRLFPWVAFCIIALFPVVVLMAVEISALRYQSDGVNLAQRIALAIDLLVLMWFFHRQRLAVVKVSRFGFAWLRVGLLWGAPAALAVVNLVWFNIPGPETITIKPGQPDATSMEMPLWNKMAQPLDLVLCPSFGWGCRFLTVDHRTLVGHVWKQEAIADLRSGGATAAALAAVEGVFLRSRILRFAKLDDSRLYGADLVGADLYGADLLRAHLEGADLQAANLTGANVSDAHLEGAELLLAHLEGANLSEAHLEGAYLSWAQLEGVNLFRAHLEGANLFRARLDGANLSEAHLEGANLSEAHLEGAYLSQSRLWQSLLDQTEVGLVDLRAADFATAIPEKHREEILKRLSALPDVQEHVKQVLTLHDQPAPKFIATDGPVLVRKEDLPDHVFDAVRMSLTTDETAYHKQLVPFLADKLASTSPAIATGIFQLSVNDRAVNLQLMANAQAGTIKFSNSSILEFLERRFGANAAAQAARYPP